MSDVDKLINKLEGVLPEFQNKHYDTFEVRVDLMIEDILRSLKEIETNYNNLVKVSIETAFDEDNNDTEFLLRTLLSQGKISFDSSKKEYTNPLHNKEFDINGIMYSKEKMYLINDDKLDDYTKQLENDNKSMLNRINELILEYKRIINNPNLSCLKNYNELKNICESIISVAKYIKTGNVKDEESSKEDEFSRLIDTLSYSIMKDLNVPNDKLGNGNN